VKPGTPRILVFAIGTHDYILHWAAWRAARDAGEPLKIPLRSVWSASGPPCLHTLPTHTLPLIRPLLQVPKAPRESCHQRPGCRAGCQRPNTGYGDAAPSHRPGLQWRDQVPQPLRWCGSQLQCAWGWRGRGVLSEPRTGEHCTPRNQPRRRLP
jgi:hypothetical protein